MGFDLKGCDKEANYSVYLGGAKDQILVGDRCYACMCAECYDKFMNKTK